MGLELMVIPMERTFCDCPDKLRPYFRTQIAWLHYGDQFRRPTFVSSQSDACQPAAESRQRKKNLRSVSRGASGNGLELWFHCPLRAADRPDNGVAVELACKATPSLQAHNSIGSVSLGMTIFLPHFPSENSRVIATRKKQGSLNRTIFWVHHIEHPT